MKNKIIRATTVLLVLILLVAVGIKGKCEQEEMLSEAEISDALLYAISGDEAEYEMIYNVCYQVKLNQATVILDNTGNNIDTIEELSSYIGDAPILEEVTPGDKYGDSLGKLIIADISIKNGSATNISINNMAERPTIGISWSRDGQVENDHIEIAEALMRNGAKVIFLKPVATEQEARETLNQIDGIFMTGGEDVNPKWYQQESFPHGASGWNDVRDTSDIFLVQEAIELDVPLLSVCRGTQVFNVAMGGGLIQDIPTYLGEKSSTGEIEEARVQIVDDSGCEPPHYRVIVDNLNHLAGGDYPYHPIEIEENSKWLETIVGGNKIDWVSSWHHQAVNPEQLGDGITIAATSTDGIVEAIEHKDSTFALGLQFHPEKDTLGDSRGVDVDQDICNAFLRELVKYSTNND